MGWFSRNRGEGTMLALDIGTEIVKALVFDIQHDQHKGVVTGVGRVVQKPGNMQSGAVANISGVIVSAREAIELAKSRAGVKRISKSVIGIAGELVKGSTTTVHYERVNPEVQIGLPELKLIVQRVQEKAYERIRKQLAWETGQDTIDVKLINAAMVDVRIDGYQVSNPLGFQGSVVQMSVFNAYAPLMHLGAIESIADELDLDLLSVAAEPYAVARSVETDQDNLDFSAIFIDIGGGTTDIAVVRNGGLEGTKMFALGGRAFTKRLAQEFKLPFDTAEKLKLDYANGRLPAADTERITALYADDCMVWLGGVELSLMEFAETDLLPPRIYLCGGGSGLPGIRTVLVSGGWSQPLAFPRTPEVSYLQPADVTHMQDATGDLINSQDVTPLGLANLAVLDAVVEEKAIAQILRRSMEQLSSD